MARRRTVLLAPLVLVPAPLPQLGATTDLNLNWSGSQSAYHALVHWRAPESTGMAHGERNPRPTAAGIAAHRRR